MDNVDRETKLAVCRQADSEVGETVDYTHYSDDELNDIYVLVVEDNTAKASV